MVGDCDSAEPLGLGLVEQQLRGDAAVVRCARVHVQVDHDPVAVREWIRIPFRRTPAAPQPFVDLLELARDLRERLAFGGLPARGGATLAIRVVVGKPSHLGGGELRLLEHAGRRRDGRTCRRRFECDARDAPW